jgi:hypothetical protein
MKIPRDLDAADLISVLCRHFSCSRVHQVGSHVILETEEPTHRRNAEFDIERGFSSQEDR